MSNQRKNHDFWVHKVKEIKASGLSVAAWVRQNEGYTVHQVRYWLRKIKKQSENQPSSSDWVSVHVDNTSHHSSQMILHLPNGSRLEIPSGLPPKELQHLLQAVNTL